MVLNDVFLKFGMVKLKNRATHKISLVGIRLEEYFISRLIYSLTYGNT